MNNFTYLQTSQAKDATAAVRDNKDAAFIAGGTTLLDLMKLNVANWSTSTCSPSRALR